MNIKFNLLLLVILSAFFSACSRQTTMKEVSFGEKGDANQVKKGEIVFDDLKPSDENAPELSQTNRRNLSLAGVDNSEIVVMEDNYGNRVETRTFRSHQRVTCVILSTHADGKREIKVYGQNGELKTLPAEMLDRVMTARGDEIANAAGITQGRQMQVRNLPPVGNPNGGMSVTVLPPIRLPQPEAPESVGVQPEQTAEKPSAPEVTQTQPVEPPKEEKLRLAKKQEEEK
jgi:hypothetical protein